MTNDIEVTQDEFGILKSEDNFSSDSQVIQRFTLRNKSTGVAAQVITYGATLTSLKVPDKNGKLDDIILGFDDLDGYLGKRVDNPYFGATIGRVTNRIAHAKFTLDGQEVKLSVNASHTHPTVSGHHNLHGGFRGFDKRVWNVAKVIQGKGVTLSYTSEDGEEGFPGQVEVKVTFELTSSSELSIHYEATSNKRTPVALTNHPYFNLSGHEHAAKPVENHSILINADNYTPADPTFIPTGEIKSVAGTPFDFRTSQNLTQRLKEYPDGYNHNFCINGQYGDQPRFAARAEEELNGRILEVWTNQPAIQFYTSCYMPAPGSPPIPGKSGTLYAQSGAFCLETQNYPNAINQANFPNCVLSPGEVYTHRIILRFTNTNTI